MTHSISIAATSNPFHRAASGGAFVSALRAGHCAHLIAEGFLRYDAAFREVTRRAPERFCLQDWQGSQLDEAERMDLYEQHVNRAAAEIHSWCYEQVPQATFWQDVMRHFAITTDGLADEAICHTFCHSVLVELYRKSEGAFMLPLAVSARIQGPEGVLASVRRCLQHGSLDTLIGRMLQAICIEPEWSDLSLASGQVARALCESRNLRESVGELQGVEMVDAVFYRFTRAYVVASLKGTAGQKVFALEIRNGEEGVSVEDVLIGELAVGKLFAFNGACFHVELEHSVDTANYLQTLVPGVSVADFLTVIGRPGRARVSRSLVRASLKGASLAGAVAQTR